ncbi:DUF4265 domain-containing protein [Actinomadura viridis]|uniref:DUF4265 domain-containing protein n=1 Tax=Actinomadura viridis TaxID=58110 RepID=UPI0036CCFB93
METDDGMTTSAERHGHVGLTSDEPDGRVVREAVPSRLLGDGSIEILGSPALVVGCAAGDAVRIDEDGRFQVVRQGPNTSVQAFAEPAFSAEDVERLSGGLRDLGGIVETPPDRTFLVATVPLAAGRSTINALVHRWAASIPGIYWQYGTAVDRREPRPNEEGPGEETSGAFSQLDLFR